MPRTSTFALTNTTFPFLEKMAALGVEEALRGDPALSQGVNVWRGELVCEGVAESLQLEAKPLEELLPGGARP